MSRLSRILNFSIPTALAIAVVAPRCLRPIEETDAGWHLALGRVIVTSGIPRTNLLTWTARDYPWYPTSWLFDVASFLSARSGGVLGLQLLVLGLVAAALVALGWACVVVHPRGAWAVPATGLLLLPRITERPHVATWPILATVLALCLVARTRGWQWRAAALPLLALGSNLHSGAALPVGVYGLFCLEALVRERRWSRELVLMALGAATMLMNPGGLFNTRYLLQNFDVPDILRVGEIESPTLKRAPLFFGSAAVAILSAWAARRRQPLFLPLTLIFFAFGCYALRFVYEFSIVIAPVFAAGLAWLEERSPRVEAVAIALGLILLGVGRQRYLGELRTSAVFDPATLPVGAARFIADQSLGARGFTGFRDGGYLEYAVPDLLTFQDGRVQAFPPTFFPEELKAEKTPESFQGWLRERGVEWALASRVKEQLDGWHKLHGPEWALVYWDDASEVYLRRDVPRFAERIPAIEFRTYGPDVPLDAVPPSRLQDLGREAFRAIQSGADTADAELARCYAAYRLHAPEANDDCTRATSMAGDRQLRVLSSLVAGK